MNSKTQPIERRGFLELGLTAAGTLGRGSVRSATQAPGSFELEEMTVARLREALTAGRFASEALAQMHLSRIDRQGSAVNSIIELNPGALSVARVLDQGRKAKGPRGPLHGIPVLLTE